MLSGSKTSNSDSEDGGGTSKATGDKLKCEQLSHTLADGHLVCNGVEIGATCWTVCIEGYKKENELIGSFECEENGEWNGERTTCVRKDCGSHDQVVKSR